MPKLLHKKRGFSLVEMVVYVAILSFLVVIIVTLLSGLLNSQKNLKAAKNVENSGIYSFERMIREIRNASDIDLAGTVANIHPGVLKLNSFDAAGNPKTVEFYASAGAIRVKENSVDLGPLTTDKANVKNLIFRPISSGESSGVKIEMEVESGTSTYYKSAKFYGTAIIRSTY